MCRRQEQEPLKGVEPCSQLHASAASVLSQVLQTPEHRSSTHLQLGGVKAGRFVHVLQQASGRAHQDVHACSKGGWVGGGWAAVPTTGTVAAAIENAMGLGLPTKCASRMRLQQPLHHQLWSLEQTSSCAYTALHLSAAKLTVEPRLLPPIHPGQLVMPHYVDKYSILISSPLSRACSSFTSLPPMSRAAEKSWRRPTLRSSSKICTACAQRDDWLEAAAACSGLANDGNGNGVSCSCHHSSGLE